jgi:hypothetical protein
MADKPLAGLDRLVGGCWVYVPNGPDDEIRMLHKFEWELDGHALMARSYNPETSPPKQVSSDIWYWHPTEKVIRNLGVVMFGPEPSIFNYSAVTIDGNKMICDFSTADGDGQSDFREIWEFTDADHYDWKLYARTSEGGNEIRHGRFERQK